MGVGLSLLDGVVSKLGETSFGTATVERQILPEVRKKNLDDPLIVVAMQGKEGIELDRNNTYISYTVGVGLSYPVSAVSDHALGLDMVEDVQDWLLEVDNRKITTASGTFCLVPPFDMEGLFDTTMLKEGGVMFFITNFNYRFFKNRN